ncbi:hypothetical protein V6N11_060642 [Hibiscus sabdariffa]|uniref:Uncharacterized protein n=1 Tax=Hibiscus sabdariffa TaxID=183260 RepID=A0ABR2QQZ1_9ROSI
MTLSKMTPRMIQNFNGESTEKCSKLSIAKGFVVHTDHQVRRFNQYQEKLNAKESKWVFFLSSCVIRHKAGKHNVVADALSRRAMLLQSAETVVNYGGSLRGPSLTERKERDLLSCRILLCLVHLAGKEAESCKLARVKGETALKAAMASESVVQLRLLMALPMIMEIGLERGFINALEIELERGFITALSEMIIMQLQLAAVFFTFSLGTKVSSIWFHDLYTSDWLHVVLSFILVIGFLHFIFNPSGFEWQKLVEDWDEWQKIVEDWDDWTKWISSHGGIVGDIFVNLLAFMPTGWAPLSVCSLYLSGEFGSSKAKLSMLELLNYWNRQIESKQARDEQLPLGIHPLSFRILLEQFLPDLYTSTSLGNVDFFDSTIYGFRAENEEETQGQRDQTLESPSFFFIKARERVDTQLTSPLKEGFRSVGAGSSKPGSRGARSVGSRFAWNPILIVNVMDPDIVSLVGLVH